MIGEEQSVIPPSHPSQPHTPDAGAEARANDIIEALVQTKAWQDSERKADDEKKVYGSNPTD